MDMLDVLIKKNEKIKEVTKHMATVYAMAKTMETMNQPLIHDDLMSTYKFLGKLLQDVTDEKPTIRN